MDVMAPPPISPEDMRAADVDRERVATRLSHAHAEGRLDLGEFDERVTAAWAARTVGELSTLVADLPDASLTASPTPPSSPPPTPAARRGNWLRLNHLQCGRRSPRVWVTLVVAFFVLRSLVALASGDVVDRWWIWLVVAVVIWARWVTSRRHQP